MSISVLGIYVADLVFFGNKIPVEGETILGNNFVIGPGGKVTPTTSSGVGVDGSGTESLDGDQPQEDRIARRKGTT